MNKPDKKALQRLYIEECKPIHKVAEELGIATGTVFNYLRIYNIKTRPPHKGMLGKTHKIDSKKAISVKNTGRRLSDEVKEKISKSHKGKRYAKNKWGGHKKARKDGYIGVYVPEHPYANKDGYVMEHRLVMEEMLGRYLKENEIVHHINSNREDNRPENLMIFNSTKDHIKYHAFFRKRSDDLSIKYI